MLQKCWPMYSGCAEIEGGLYRVSLMPLASDPPPVVNVAVWHEHNVAESRESFEEALKRLADKVHPRTPLPF